MRIGRTISGPRNTSSTYGQEMAKSKKAIENVLKEKDEQQMKYVLSVAEIKASGQDLSIPLLKEVFGKTMVKGAKGEVALEKMRLVNLYLNSLSREEAQRFIEKFDERSKNTYAI